MAGRVYIIGHGTLGCRAIRLMCVVTNTTINSSIHVMLCLVMHVFAFVYTTPQTCVYVFLCVFVWCMLQGGLNFVPPFCTPLYNYAPPGGEGGYEIMK